MVLPAPGGPVTTVSGLHRVPWTISFVIRRRCTAHSGTPGAVIFDARIGWPAETADRPARVTRLAASVASVFIAPAMLPLLSPLTCRPSATSPRDTGRHDSRLQWKAPSTTQNRQLPGHASCHRY